jgi:hypothetical protein
VAAGVLIWMVSRGSRWHAAAGWIALALAGQACSLQLLWVGSDVRLQLFYGWSELLRSYQGIFFVAVVLQAAIVLWGLRQLRPGSTGYLQALITWPQALLLLILTGYAATTIQPAVAQRLVTGTGFTRSALLYLSKAALGLFVFATGALNLVLAARAIPGDWLDHMHFRWKQSDRRWLPWACASWVVVVSSLLAWFALDRMPHVPDEVAYLFQAKYLATGHLYLPPPPSAPSLACPFQMVDGNKWYGSPPAGWPLALAIGTALGLPWLVNPLLGGIAILLSHRLLRRLYDREVADAAVFLLAASPWLLFLSASYMPHAVALVLALLGLLGVQEARESGSIIWAGVAGFGIGGLLHVRGLEAVIVAAVAAIWWLGVGWLRLRIPAVVTTCIVGLIMTGLYLGYNRVLTGDAFQVPINKFTDITYYKGANRLGFGRDVGNFGWNGLDALPGHGPIDVVMNTNQNIYLVNFEMFGWACGSLFFVFLLLVWGGSRGNTLMWGLVLALWAGMSLYWFSGGPDFGARYWYLMIVPLVALTALGAQAAALRLGAAMGNANGTRVWAFVALATLLGVINLVPWRSLDKYHNYRGVRPDVRVLRSKYHFGRSLVFVRGPEWPDYASAIPFNPPTFGPDAAGTIYARDLGPEADARLRSYYSDRPVWVIAGPSETHGGFTVLEGPLHSQEMKR